MKSILNIFKKRKIENLSYQINNNEIYFFINEIYYLFEVLNGKISDIIVTLIKVNNDGIYTNCLELELKTYADVIIDRITKERLTNFNIMYRIWNIDDQKKADEIFDKICDRKKTLEIEHLNYLRKEKLKSLEKINI